MTRRFFFACAARLVLIAVAARVGFRWVRSHIWRVRNADEFRYAIRRAQSGDTIDIQAPITGGLRLPPRPAGEWVRITASGYRSDSTEIKIDT